MAATPVHVSGLREFNRAVKGLSSELPKAVRLALNDAAAVIVDHAVPKVPRRTGRAQRSLKARSTRTTARVAGGSRQAPYYPWLDFGGRVGRRNTASRPFLRDGRYLYATYFEHRDEFVRLLSESLEKVARRAGMVVE